MEQIIFVIMGLVILNICALFRLLTFANLMHGDSGKYYIVCAVIVFLFALICDYVYALASLPSANNPTSVDVLMIVLNIIVLPIYYYVYRQLKIIATRERTTHYHPLYFVDILP